MITNIVPTWQPCGRPTGYFHSDVHPSSTCSTVNFKNFSNLLPSFYMYFILLNVDAKGQYDQSNVSHIGFKMVDLWNSSKSVITFNINLQNMLLITACIEYHWHKWKIYQLIWRLHSIKEGQHMVHKLWKSYYIA